MVTELTFRGDAILEVRVHYKNSYMEFRAPISCGEEIPYQHISSDAPETANDCVLLIL
jgi:hypothetical protein